MRVIQTALMLGTMVFFYFLLAGLDDLTKAVNSEKVQINMSITELCNFAFVEFSRISGSDLRFDDCLQITAYEAYLTRRLLVPPKKDSDLDKDKDSR